MHRQYSPQKKFRILARNFPAPGEPDGPPHPPLQGFPPTRQLEETESEALIVARSATGLDQQALHS